MLPRATSASGLGRGARRSLGSRCSRTGGVVGSAARGVRSGADDLGCGILEISGVSRETRGGCRGNGAAGGGVAPVVNGVAAEREAARDAGAAPQAELDAIRTQPAGVEREAATTEGRADRAEKAREKAEQDARTAHAELAALKAERA